jgi:hypothetical protein
MEKSTFVSNPRFMGTVPEELKLKQTVIGEELEESDIFKKYKDIVNEFNY